LSIYKACDIRGIYGEELDEEIGLKIGRAIGTKAGGGDIALGGDVRPSTISLKYAIREGLMRSGCKVLDLGIVPTPIVYWAKERLKTRGCVIVTASHNPTPFNGVKFMIGDLPVLPQDVTEIADLVESGSFIEGNGSWGEIDLGEDYIADIKTLLSFPSAPEFKLVIEANNGCLSEIAPRVISELGFTTLKLHCSPEEGFPQNEPDPSASGNLDLLAQKVINNKAQLGIGFDGDGDRVAFVDEKGRVVQGDKSIVILSREMLRRRGGGKIVYDLKSGSIVPEMIKKHSGMPLRERSGHSFIKRRVITEKAIFGGEITGHFFYEQLKGRDDGLYSDLFLIKILLDDKRRLSEIVDEIPTNFITPDLRISYEGDRYAVLEKIEANLSSYPIDTTDGVRVDFPQGWGLIRISVTEPKLTLRFEAGREEELTNIMEEFLSAVPEIKDMVEARYEEVKDGKER